MTAKERKKVGQYLFLIVVISVALSIWGSKIDTGPIAEVVQRAGVFAPIAYIILLAIPSIIAPLSGSPIFIAGYILFGTKVIFYSYLTGLTAAAIDFYIARRWGRPWVTKLIGKDDMAKVDSFTKGYGLSSLIFLRVFQGHVLDFVSYAYGLTNMKFIPYMITTILAPIPWLLLWYLYIFPRVNSLTDFSTWFLITLIPLFAISWFYWKHKSKRK